MLNVTCPHCNSLLHSNNSPGEKIQCGNCRTVFEIPRPNVFKDLDEPERPRRRQYHPKDDSDDAVPLLTIIAVLMIFGGMCGAAFFFLYFDTTVSTQFGQVHNIGLLAKKQNGIIASIGCVILGAILALATKRNHK